MKMKYSNWQQNIAAGQNTTFTTERPSGLAVRAEWQVIL